jgi:hypothetical protein
MTVAAIQAPRFAPVDLAGSKFDAGCINIGHYDSEMNQKPGLMTRPKTFAAVISVTVYIYCRAKLISSSTLSGRDSPHYPLEALTNDSKSLRERPKGITRAETLEALKSPYNRKGEHTMAHQPKDFNSVKGSTPVPRPHAASRKTAFQVTAAARAAANPGE